jgi:GNAT superfamily N-acetyltransferase
VSSERGDVTYSYRRGSALEGTFPRDVGYFIVTECRVRFGWGGIAPGDWPNASYHAVTEPPDLDCVAKANRIRGYWRIHGWSDALRCLAVGPFAAAFEITHDWFLAVSGCIDLPSTDARVIGTHTVGINGYSARDERLTFLNSWGAAWGVGGAGTMSRQFFEWKQREAWGLLAGIPHLKGHGGYVRLEYGYKTPLGILHVIELYDAAEDDRLAWTFLLERDSFIDLQELFVKPRYRGRGLARSLVREVQRYCRERFDSRLPLRAAVYPVDARMFPEAMARLASLLELELVASQAPGTAYVARPKARVWKSRRHRGRL